MNSSDPVGPMFSGSGEQGSGSRVEPPSELADAVYEDEPVDATITFPQRNQELLQNPVEVDEEQLTRAKEAGELSPADIEKSRGFSKMESEPVLGDQARIDPNVSDQDCGGVVDVLSLAVQEEQQSLIGTVDRDISEKMDTAQTPSCHDTVLDSHLHVEYFLEKPPSLLAESLTDFMHNRENFLKGCKW